MANPFNVIQLVGRIPESEKIRYDFTAATNDAGTNARMKGLISVQRDRKPEGEQYYPNDLIPFTAWGKTAEFMDTYVKRGSVIAMVGALTVNSVPTDEGNRIYYDVQVDSVRFVPRELNERDDDVEEQEEAPAPVKPVNPFQGKTGGATPNPFKNRK